MKKILLQFSLVLIVMSQLEYSYAQVVQELVRLRDC